VRRSDRGDGMGVTLIGLLLLAGGGYGAARGFGAFGDEAADDPVITDAARSFVDRNEQWLWPAAAALAVLVAYVGWRWLRRQLVGTRVTRLDLSERAGGPTFVQTAPAAAALGRDVESYPGVRRASARFLRDGSRPALTLTVEVDDDAEVTTVNRRIDEEAFPRFRQALEVDDVDARVRYRFGAGVAASPRVR
jgi:hypothetical protein